MSADKRLTGADVVAELRSGMTIAIGGWGSRRKPMSIVREILRSSLTDLTIVTWGGPDLGLLVAAGKVKRAAYAFCSLDSIALEPNFRRGREQGLIEDEPYDEGLFHLGLQAAAWRLPFLPTRAGLGSDLLRDNPKLKLVRSPYDDAEDFVAAPAFQLDAAICHLNRADQRGNATFLGPDLYWDDLMLQAAPTGGRFISTERVVETADLSSEATVHQFRVSRMMVDGVVEAPNGAHFTSCEPDYPRDEAFQREYAASAKTPEAWAAFKSAWLDVNESEYQQRLTRVAR
ncbi:MAG TPA: CoA-transferase [Ilumatobacter sp.]|nr:CoA-transferase [Ilumatobacter sp.]